MVSGSDQQSGGIGCFVLTMRFAVMLIEAFIELSTCAVLCLHKEPQLCVLFHSHAMFMHSLTRDVQCYVILKGLLVTRPVCLSGLAVYCNSTL
jgi:hypothetical protein